MLGWVGGKGIGGRPLWQSSKSIVDVFGVDCVYASIVELYRHTHTHTPTLVGAYLCCMRWTKSEDRISWVRTSLPCIECVCVFACCCRPNIMPAPICAGAVTKELHNTSGGSVLLVSSALQPKRPCGPGHCNAVAVAGC